MREKVKNIQDTASPTIIIIAHDRPKSISRLLKSIEKAHFPDLEIELIISIDKSDVKDVAAIANDFNWRYGKKKIIEQKKHLGLRKHVLSCGKLIQEIGTSIILEDDLVVAPYFYNYALQANRYYKEDQTIGGISLYAYAISENKAYPFSPFDDGFDNYLMQVPSSWGQLFTAQQWINFFEWFDKREVYSHNYPEYIEVWGEQSWKKLFMKFLIDSGKYFVFPRKSHTTNFEDRGTHAKANGQFQVELQDYNKSYNFSSIMQSKSRYDAWFELEQDIIKEKQALLSDYDFTVDLYGTKPKQFKKVYTLTTKEVNGSIVSFGNAMFPLLQNVFYNIKGDNIHFLKSENEKEGSSNPSLFYPLTTIAENNLENSLSKKLQVGIIIPLLNWKPNELIILLESIEKQTEKNWKCTLVTPGDNVSQIEAILRKVQCSNRVNVIHYNTESPNLISLVNYGFNQYPSTILCWKHPSGVFAKEEIKAAIGIFTDFKQVKCLKQVNEKDALKHRWNQSLIERTVLGKTGRVSTEGLFIAEHIWRSMGSTFSNKSNFPKEAFWMLELLKKFPFFVFINEFVQEEEKMKQIDDTLENQIGAFEGIKSKGNKKVFSTIFKVFYKLNIPYLRSFYSLYHNLNDVIRSDKANDSYYFDRY